MENQNLCHLNSDVDYELPNECPTSLNDWRTHYSSPQSSLCSTLKDFTRRPIVIVATIVLLKACLWYLHNRANEEGIDLSEVL